ncbi:MAG: hypothetical protein FWH15_05005 [Betaproteobacteria bacterium]|nr:hypothetical protein [Betaproteobacteria bacterium]
MPFVAVGFQGVVQLRHLLGGLDVYFHLIVADALGFISGNVGKTLDVFSQVFCLEVPDFVRGTATKADVFKIADKPQVGDFLFRQMLHVSLQLAERGVQVFASAFHFNCDFAFPDIINVADPRAGKRYLVLKTADCHRVGNAKDAQKVHHKRLRLCFFITRVFPVF